MSIIGFSKFFAQTSPEIPGWSDDHAQRLSSFLEPARDCKAWTGWVRSVALPHALPALPGYRDGVCLLPVPLDVFRGLRPLKSRVVRVNRDTEFVTVCKSRVEGEKPRKKTMALVDELPDARFITAVLYHKDVLAEDNDRSTSMEWEIVALLCQVDEEEPMNTATLMANHFKADGGTATNMDPRTFEHELRKSYNYWKDRSFGVTRDEYDSRPLPGPRRRDHGWRRELPQKVDLREQLGPVQDQGELGASAVFAVNYGRWPKG